MSSSTRSLQRAARRPLRWLSEASVEEIGEALVAVDPLKASKVAAYVMARAGTAIGSRMEHAIERARQDPIGTFGRVLGALGD